MEKLNLLVININTMVLAKLEQFSWQTVPNSGTALLTGEMTDADAVLVGLHPSAKDVSIARLKEAGRPVVVLAPVGQERNVMSAMAAGADEFLIQDAGGQYKTLLPLVVQRAINRNSMSMAPALQELTVCPAHKQLVPLSFEIFCTMDPAGRLLQANEMFVQLLGYGVENRQKHSIFELFHADDVQTARTSLEQAVASKKKQTFEGRCRTQEGNYRWLAWRFFCPNGKLYATARDVTERKEIIQELREREEQFRVLTEMMAAGVFIYQSNSLLYLNPTMLELMGYEAEDLESPAVWERIEYDFRYSILKSKANRKSEHLLTPRYEIQIPGRYGETIWIDFVPSLIEYQGRPAVLGTVFDITDRKAIEKDLSEKNEAIQQQKSMLEAILHSIYDGVIVCDTAGNYIVFNDAAEQCLGLGKIDIPPEEWAETYGVYHLDQQTLYQPMEFPFYRNLQGETVTNLEVYIQNAVHTEGKYLNIYSTPLFDLQNEIIGTVGILQDIDERKKSEEQLRSSEEQLRQLLASMTVLVYATDTAGRFIVWNGEAERVSGYQAQEIIGNPQALSLLYPEPKEYQQARECLYNLAGEFHELELTLTTKNGEARVIAWTDVSEQFPVSGWASWAVGVDVTERKWGQEILYEERAWLARRVEDRTRQLEIANRELAYASKLKDEFLASMSHELRTPLNAILGMAEILLEQMFGPLTERQLHYVTTIEESGRHLLALINDILDLSKIEAGKMTLHIETIDLSSLCTASMRLVKQMAKQKKIELELSLDPNLGTVQADPVRMKQMLVNLLSNAVKFTPEKGSVKLDIRLEESHNMVNFTVSDTGIGISEAELTQLFQPFVQLDGRLNRQHEGTGLGLVLTNRLAELHGGQITVKSIPEVGSHFTIMLPWQIETSVPLPPQLPALGEMMPVNSIDEDIPEPTGPLIMLVEDNENNIATLYDFLQLLGNRVVVAHNGVEAIEMAISEQPALILMDIQMPIMDGLEATRRLRATPQTADIPIIALTAIAMSGDKERCLAAGVDDYMSKPISLKQLVERVTKYTENVMDNG